MIKIVQHPIKGTVVTPRENNPEFGAVRIDEVKTTIVNNFVNKSRRTAFLGGTVKDLTAMNFKDGQAIAGTIVKQESFNPFFEGQSPKINPSTSEVVLTDEKPTFLNYIYSADATALDVWVGNTSETIEEAVEEALESQQLAD